MVYREALVWKRLTHPNIVPFRGVIPSPLQIISEWMPGGDVTTYIRLKPHAKRVPLVSPRLPPPPNTVLLFLQIVGVATGLDYLHSRGVIHGDLKGVNVPSLPNLLISLIGACSRISWWTLPIVHV